jgi:hypothetical protein
MERKIPRRICIAMRDDRYVAMRNIVSNLLQPFELNHFTIRYMGPYCGRAPNETIDERS